MKLTKSMKDMLAQNMPPFFRRQDVEEVTAGLMKPALLANLHSQGQGPECMKVLGKVYYQRDTFLEWLFERRTYNDKHDFDAVSFGWRSYRPAGATYGFAPAREGA